MQEWERQIAFTGGCGGFSAPQHNQAKQSGDMDAQGASEAVGVPQPAAPVPERWDCEVCGIVASDWKSLEVTYKNPKT